MELVNVIEKVGEKPSYNNLYRVNPHLFRAFARKGEKHYLNVLILWLNKKSLISLSIAIVIPLLYIIVYKVKIDEEEPQSQVPKKFYALWLEVLFYF